MSGMELFRHRLPERELASIVSLGAAAEARVDAQYLVLRAGNAAIADLARQTICDAADLASITETRAARSALARPALASIFDQIMLELQSNIHLGAEAIRRAAGAR